MEQEDYVEDNNNSNSNDGGANDHDLGDEEFESFNTLSDNHEEGSNQAHKRKRYHRHTPAQIHEMESFFRECDHPDEQQRKELSRRLGLEPLQIKFWFQNKRTQSKNHKERFENSELQKTNEKLKTDNLRYKEAVNKALCPRCGGQTALGDMSSEEHHLRLQNARLSDEINRLAAMAERLTGRSVMNYPRMTPPMHPRPLELAMGASGGTVYGNGGNLPREITGPVIIDLALRAMHELMTMAGTCEPPLWTGGVDGTTLVLNVDHYTKMFQKARPEGFRTEVSRKTTVVAMNATNIVEMFMDANLWSNMFAGIVAGAMCVGGGHLRTVSVGHYDGPYDGAVLIMRAEFQVLSPQISTRKCFFVRHCRKIDGLWAVVDVSIDHPNSNFDFRRRPSGCLIQDIPNGYSKVTWVEHVEIDDRTKDYNIFQPLILSGEAYGANRWVTQLERQCERMSSIMSIDFQSANSVPTPNGKLNLLKLAVRMERSFLDGLNISKGTIARYSGAGRDVSLMTMKNDNDPGKPSGIILCATTSIWLPFPPNIVFDYIRDENHRIQWDVQCTRGNVQKIAEVPNGSDNRNCATVLMNANKQMIVQETSTNPTASFVVSAPVETASIDSVLTKDGNPDFVRILPCGFAIIPDGMAQHQGNGGGGSLVTVSFQMLPETTSSGKMIVGSVETLSNLTRAAAMNIKAVFAYQNA